MKRTILKTGICILLAIIFAGLSGCISGVKSPMSIERSTDVTPAQIPSTPEMTVSVSTDKLIDTDVILDAVAASAEGKLPDDVSVFNFILNRKLISLYADTDLKKMMMLGLYSAVLTSQKSYDIPQGLNLKKKEIKFIMNLLDSDAPELIHLAEEYKYLSTESTVQSVEFNYTKTPSQLHKRLTKLFGAIKSWQGTLDNSYETELRLHDKIIETCVYTKDSSEGGNAYGAIVNGKALCEGYSDAFTLAMFLSNIKCLQLWGEALNNQGKIESHAWNLVELDGEWYQVDVTWDDYVEEKYPASLYAYMNVTDAQLAQSHTVNSTLANLNLPKCTATKYNYHRINSNIVEQGGDYNGIIRNKINSMYDARKKKMSFTLAFMSSDDYHAMFNGVDNLFEEWVNEQQDLSSLEYSYIYDSAMNVVMFEVALEY